MKEFVINLMLFYRKIKKKGKKGKKKKRKL